MRRASGQTLIETLITVLLIGLGVVALIRFQNYLTYDSSVSQQRTEAYSLAVRKIEQLRDFQVLENTAGYTSYNSIASGNETTAGLSATYTTTWTVTTNATPAYKNIDVTVSWTDRYNRAQSVRLTTNVAAIDPSAAVGAM